MTLTPIAEKRIEQILKSFAAARHRDFTVVFATGGSKFLGSYLRKTRTVTLHPKKFDNQFELIGGGLHELAHHLIWEMHPGARLAHGKEFRGRGHA